MSNYFAKRNYQVGKDNKVIERQINSLTKDANKNALLKLLEIGKEYFYTRSKLLDDLENISKVDDKLKETLIDYSIHYIVENKKDEINKIKEGLNGDLTEPSWLSRQHDKVAIRKFEQLEKIKSAKDVVKHENDPEFLEKYGSEFLDLEKRGSLFHLFIFDIYLSNKHKNILKVFNSLEDIGFEFDDYSKETLIDKKYYEYKKWGNTWIPKTKLPIVFNAELIKSAPNIWSSNRNVDIKFDIKFNYEETYAFFTRNESFSLRVIKSKIKKLDKKDKERNLRALASEKTSKTRQVAKSQRSKVNFDEQVGVYKNCPYCQNELGKFKGKNAAHLDHIHPVSKGGMSTKQNLVYICNSCNLSKKDKTLNSFIYEEKLNMDDVFEILRKLDKDF